MDLPLGLAAVNALHPDPQPAARLQWFQAVQPGRLAH
jgi:hypothetical protein